MQGFPLLPLSIEIALLLLLVLGGWNSSTAMTMVNYTLKLSSAALYLHHDHPAGRCTAVYIVYTEEPPQGADPESHHLHILSCVLGSEEAAREALLYVYETAATGFSAKLTPQQASELAKQPGVLQVAESQEFELHPDRGINGMSE